ncbi:hypothetical protein GCM10007872_09280 [Gluconobacter sphaericus NBRC 12467]|uniref:Transposase IS4-like domain-containing protein n=1 Tax=Gluconobacter sphaericus NBRC 12467 TaxID=1307951 RepID=A0AA37W9I9_9PROT|nr:transposase [Gluconobacter sphaericus NBRC 12467]GEB43727.1 hypothetical protein GSP01_25090 [Gluconobacter sphaericus NBRC 12467]GLQ84020.1 hypothetical protein GCM10007872_09280 [Gluconobacter sphaericus NBRC 12467]
MGDWVLDIVKRSDRAQSFVLLSKRWIVERTFAWLGRCRRLNRDVEATLQASQAWLIVAHIRRVLQKITQTDFRVRLYGMKLVH